MTKDYIAEQMRELQCRITSKLEKIDGKAIFSEDPWERTEGGGGYTRTIKEGSVIEKGGVAFSKVYGPVSDLMKRQLNLDGNHFFATGVSIVLHPKNPFVPIIHMNVRYFELSTGVYWFGGGIDLTPHYVEKTQAKHFHQKLKSICDQYNKEFYSAFKDQADDYFFIPHRNETRGVGGIFYDHINEDNSGLSKEKLFDFAIKLGDSFPEIYAEQVSFGKDKNFTEENIKWRNLRRGRYVEFNLVNDRGTKFGLFSGGRTESILMSLPPLANWEYNLVPSPNTDEYKTIEMLKKSIDWVNG